MSLPARFIERTRALFGTRGDRIVEALAHGQELRAARVNPLKIDRAEFFRLHGAFPPLPFGDDGFYADESIRGADPLHAAGLYYIQEASAQLPVALARPYIRGRVLDLCAAPGGKTCQLAACNPDVLYANEVVYKRTPALKSNLERLGVRNAIVTCNTAEEYAERLSGFFDAVLVDAPCSGEGMLRKEAAALSNWSEANILACAERSYGILCNAAETVKTGGALVYSTCTLNREENEDVIERFLATHDFALVPPSADILRGAESGFLAHTVRILPDSGVGEGHFACCMVRQSDIHAKRPQQVRWKRAKCDIKRIWDQVSAVPMWGEPYEQDGWVFLAPDAFGNMNFLQCGVRIAVVDKTVKPYHSLALALRKGETANALALPPDDPRLKQYLSGGELQDPPFAGWGTVTVHGYPVGLVKCGDAIKNHYPKGLWLS